MKRIALLFAVSLGFLWLLGQLIGEPWFYQGLGVSHPSTAAALLLFMLVVPVFTFFLQPVSRPDWTCRCGESLGVQFTQCWRCGAYRVTPA